MDSQKNLHDFQRTTAIASHVISKGTEGRKDKGKGAFPRSVLL